MEEDGAFPSIPSNSLAIEVQSTQVTFERQDKRTEMDPVGVFPQPIPLYVFVLALDISSDRFNMF